jgi:hypothetical protein
MSFSYKVAAGVELLYWSPFWFNSPLNGFWMFINDDDMAPFLLIFGFSEQDRILSCHREFPKKIEVDARLKSTRFMA